MLLPKWFQPIMNFLDKTWDDKSGWGKLKRITAQLSPDSNMKKILTVLWQSRFYETKCCKRLQLREKRGKYVVCTLLILSLVFVGFYVCRLLLWGKWASYLRCLLNYGFDVKTWQRSGKSLPCIQCCFTRLNL